MALQDICLLARVMLFVLAPGGADTVAPAPPYEPPDTFPGGADTATKAR